MPAQKDLKKLVRTRMQKTGESYTTARLHLVTSKSPSKTRQKQNDAPPKQDQNVDYAALAGMSDEKVKQATGCDWAKWVWVLDRAGAASMSHRDMARMIREKYGTPSWWTQMVTVGYERIRGLRDMRQSRGGGYNAGASKTIAAEPEAILAAVRNARVRAKWLPAIRMTLRSREASKSLRFRLEDDSTVEFGMYPATGGRQRVAFEHRGVATKEDADRMKAFWKSALAALSEHLAK